MNLNQYIDRIYVINLDDRAAKWTKLENQLIALGISGYERFSAIQPAWQDLDQKCFEHMNYDAHWVNDPVRYTIGASGCKLSHLGVIKDAKAKGYSKILVLEDDVEIDPGINIRFAEIIGHADEIDWVMLYLGVRHKTPGKKVGKDLLGVSRGYQTHAYILKDTSYDLILNDALQSGVEIDVYYANFIHPNHVSLAFDPPLINQCGAPSDINSLSNNLCIGETFSGEGVGQDCDPVSLLSSCRIDVMGKLLYAQAYLNEWKSPFPEILYKEHLRVWNGFKEKLNPEKNCYDAFKQVFNQVLDSIRTHGFDSSVSTIPLNPSGGILNGSHRLAASLAQATRVSAHIERNEGTGQQVADFRYFEGLALGAKWMDVMALQYACLKPNTFIALVFPSTNRDSDYKETDRILREFGGMVYAKSVTLENEGPVQLVRQLYRGEKWAGGWKNSFRGIRDKVALCFKTKRPLRVYLMEFETMKDVLAAKNKVRNLFDVGNHSIHINDTHRETVELAQMLLNKNSIHFLNNSRLRRQITFERLLRDYQRALFNQKVNTDRYCVTASSVLSVYGLRDCKDIDYLHIESSNELSASREIQSHNQYGVGRYSTNPDDILLDPENHFFYGGVKYVSLEIIRLLKLQRNEPKDVKDVALIDSLYELKSENFILRFFRAVWKRKG
ncbi:glycosyltransferase family 25 protein [bacterium]|nr:glycosyltransferase family 25 protein [bacterium]